MFSNTLWMIIGALLLLMLTALPIRTNAADIKDSEFTGVPVQLDGNTYENVTFTRSLLVYNGGPVTFKNVTIRDCKLRLTGSAAFAVGLWQMFNHPAIAAAPRPQAVPQQGPIRQIDVSSSR